jgi:hypothetical protein
LIAAGVRETLEKQLQQMKKTRMHERVSEQCRNRFY